MCDPEEIVMRGNIVINGKDKPRGTWGPRSDKVGFYVDNAIGLLFYDGCV